MAGEKRVFVNPKTGEEREFEVDENGKPIFDGLFSQKSGTTPSIKAPTTADRLFQGIPIKLGALDTSIGTRDVAPTLQAIGGQVGSTFGPFGRIAGNVVGYAPGLALRALAPELFGTVKEPMEEAGNLGLGTLFDVGTTGAGKVLSGGFPSVRERLKQQLVQRFFPSTIDDEMKAAIKADPKFHPTVGQVNPEAEFLERTFSPIKKTKILQEQEKRLLGQAQANVFNKEELVKEAQKKARSEAAYLKKEARRKYQEFEPSIEFPGNTKTVMKEIPGQTTTIYGANGQPIQVKGRPTYENVRIKGAIPLDKSKSFVDEVLPILNEELGPNDTLARSIGTTSGAHLIKLRDELNKIGGIQTFLDPKTKQPTKTYGEFRQLKAVRDSLNRFTQSSEYDVMRDKLQGPLQYLEQSLRDDIEEGVKTWGPNAYNKFRAAQQHYAEMSDKLNPEMTNALIRAGKDPETTYMQVYKKALSDPQMTRQARDIAGRDEIGKIFKNELSEQVIDPTGGLNPNKALIYLQDKDLVAKEAIPSNELTNAKAFLKRAQLIGPYTQNTSTALNFRLGSAALDIGRGGLAGLTTGQVPKGLLEKGVTMVLGAAGGKRFVEDVLFNPKNARIAMGLLDADPISAKAKWGTRAMIGAMKGGQIMVMAPDGNKYEATIDENGKLRFDNSK